MLSSRLARFEVLADSEHLSRSVHRQLLTAGRRVDDAPIQLAVHSETADLEEWPRSPGRRFFAAVAAMEVMVISFLPTTLEEWAIIATIAPITPP